MKDELFKQNYDGRFEFNEAVALVFDDMISRSIPLYDQFLKITLDTIGSFCKPNDKICDFGCSTANTLLAIDREYKHSFELIGVDTSEHMLKQAKNKANIYNAKIALINCDILNLKIDEVGCVIANFTMQFIPPENRIEAFKKAFKILKNNGVFIFAEKLASNNESLDNFLVEKYYDYKKAQGYSELEIMQKRAALENVLIPFSEQQNIEAANSVGFTHTECIFRVLNFALFVAFK